MSRQYAVIGLGRGGSALVRSLHDMGHEVLGIDADRSILQSLSASLPSVHFVAANVSEASVLRDLGLDRFDGAAVTIGENVQASILITLMLKEELKVPLVAARATSQLHARVLKRVGADRIIQPEKEAGEELARIMAAPQIMEYLDIGSGEAIVELQVPERWVGKTLADLQLPRRGGLTVLVVRHAGGHGTIPRANTALERGDVLVVGGTKEALDRFDPSKT